MRFKGDRVKLLQDSDGVPAGAMGTVLENSVAPWIELDEAYEGLSYMPAQGKKDKLGHYICMGMHDIELCEQVSDEMPPSARPSPDSGLPPVADASSDYTDMGVEAKHYEEVDKAVYENAGTRLMDKAFSVQDTLAQRGSRYGDFTTNAEISQHLKSIMETNSDGSMREGWRNLTCVQREALTMIAQKIARILNGDPNYKDNWHDIQGYARLAEDRCKSSD